MEELNIKQLMVDVKEAWVPYPEFEGFDVKIAHLGREKLIELRNSCMETTFDRKTRQPRNEVNERKFVEKFTNATLKDWKGLKIKYLEQMMLIQTNAEDLDKEVPYSPENAQTLVTNSSTFDNWLNDVVFDLDNFRTRAD